MLPSKIQLLQQQSSVQIPHSSVYPQQSILPMRQSTPVDSSASVANDLEILLSDLETDIDDDLSSSSSATKISATSGQWRSSVENSAQLFQPQLTTVTPDIWKTSGPIFLSESPSTNLAQTQEPTLSYPPPPFPSPPKLIPVHEKHPGTDVASLQELTIALAKGSILEEKNYATVA